MTNIIIGTKYTPVVAISDRTYFHVQRKTIPFVNIFVYSFNMVNKLMVVKKIIFHIKYYFTSLTKIMCKEGEKVKVERWREKVFSDFVFLSISPFSPFLLFTPFPACSV